MWKKIFRYLLVILFSLLLLSSAYFFLYANSLRGVNQQIVKYYDQLKQELVKQGYRPALVVISARRAAWHNDILTSFGAARNSQHLKGNALDLMVLDVNADGSMDRKDVMIVRKILEKLIGDQGGIGTYLSEEWFWNRQMIHIDCRGKRARWER
mgnify:CR=1 FL=1